MSTDLIEVKADEKTVLAQYPVTPEEVANLVAPYRELEISDVNDSKGYKAVDEARKELKKTRVAIENRRKALKADALEYGRMVDGAAKQLSGPITQVESELDGKLKAIDDEKIRIKQQRLQDRIDRLAVIGCSHEVRSLDEMSDNDFETLHAAKKAENEERLAREAKEAEERRKEQEQLAKEREELEQLRREQAARKEAEEAAARAEQQRIQQVVSERKQQLSAIGVTAIDGQLSGMTDEEFATFFDQQKSAAEAKKKQDEELRVERERLADIERKQQEERDALEAEKLQIEQRRRQEEAAELAAKEAGENERKEAERQEKLKALLPDRDKLLAVADAIKAIEVPEVSVDMHEVAFEVADLISECESKIRQVVTKATAG